MSLEDIIKTIQKKKVANTLEHTHPHPEFWKGWNKAIEEVVPLLCNLQKQLTPISKEEFAKECGNKAIIDRVEQSPCDSYTLSCYQAQGRIKGEALYDYLASMNFCLIRRVRLKAE